jgi:hypothetical protein
MEPEGLLTENEMGGAFVTHRKEEKYMHIFVRIV